MNYLRAAVFVIVSSLASFAIGSDIQIQDDVLYPYQTSVELQEEFVSAGTSTGNLGNYGFGLANGTTSSIASETNRPGILRRDTSAVSGTITTVTLFPHSSSVFAANLPHRIVWVTRLNTNDANTTMRMGIGNSTVASPPGTGIYFEKADADTNWFCVTESGTRTRTDSGVAVDTNFKTFEYRRLSASVEFYINGALVCTNTADLSTALSNPFTQIVNSAAASKTMDIDYFQLQLTGLTR